MRWHATLVCVCKICSKTIEFGVIAKNFAPAAQPSDLRGRTVRTGYTYRAFAYSTYTCTWQLSSQVVVEAVVRGVATRAGAPVLGWPVVRARAYEGAEPRVARPRGGDKEGLNV